MSGTRSMSSLRTLSRVKLHLHLRRLKPDARQLRILPASSAFAAILKQWAADMDSCDADSGGCDRQTRIRLIQRKSLLKLGAYMKNAMRPKLGGRWWGKKTEAGAVAAEANPVWAAKAVVPPAWAVKAKNNQQGQHLDQPLIMAMQPVRNQWVQA